VPPIGDRSTFRFGIFELDSSTGELRKGGKTRPRLQGQPLELALHLLARPGEVVTREDLRKRLWPADTFVDYDHSLNTAVNKLREALGDSAGNPRFIQTLPGQGYRFIAPVNIVARACDQSPAPFPAQDQSASLRFLSDPRELPPVKRATARAIFSLIQLLYLGFYVALLVSPHYVLQLVSETIPFPLFIFVIFILTALAGIPLRLYLLSAALFGYHRLSERFQRLFPLVFPLDELWALAPFLIVDWIGIGPALAATAILLYLPFSQRSILLMGDRASSRAA
jgi:DNA-binding winged helix-turn-helix (wHTH) protein